MKKPQYAYLVHNGKIVEVLLVEDNGLIVIKHDERIFWVQPHEIEYI
jgi:hypothetical protein